MGRLGSEAMRRGGRDDGDQSQERESMLENAVESGQIAGAAAADV